MVHRAKEYADEPLTPARSQAGGDAHTQANSPAPARDARSPGGATAHGPGGGGSPIPRVRAATA